MESAGAKPGLLTLDLEINKDTLSDEDRKQAKYQLEQLKCDLELNSERPHRHDIENMIGVILYRLQDEELEDEELATDVLETALKTDPHNVNILHDLCSIYDREYRKEDASEHQKQLKSELDKIRDGQGGLAYARCLAGKGLAWGFDLHPETKGTNRLDNSISFYEKALSIAGEALDIKEKEDWLYYLALGYVRKNNIKVKMNEVESYYKETFEKAIDCLKPNLKSEDTQRKSAAWCLLGKLFSQRPPKMTTIPTAINKDFKLKPYWIRPEMCFLQSLEFDDKNCIALNELAHLHFDNGKTDEALKLLDRSLEIREGIANTIALHRRAQIFRIMFNKQLQRKQQSNGPPPDQSLLQKAKKDLLLCIQFNPYVLDMIHLAEIYHKLAWKEKSSSYEKKGLKEALRWCTKAVKCQDGAIRPELHQKRALILQDLGDHESAVNCFMEAMDCENPGTKYNRNFIYMFNGMLDRYHTGTEKPKHMLHELAYWLDEGLDKYAKTKIKVSSFVRRCPEEMLCVAEVLSNSKRRRQLELAQKLVDAFRDTQVSCDKVRLQTISEDAKRAITSQPVSSPGPGRPTTPKISSKGRKLNLKLDTSPEKDDKSSPFHASSIISAQGAVATGEKKAVVTEPKTSRPKITDEQKSTRSASEQTVKQGSVGDATICTKTVVDEESILDIKSENKDTNTSGVSSTKSSEQTESEPSIPNATEVCERDDKSVKASQDEVASAFSQIAITNLQQAQKMGDHSLSLSITSPQPDGKLPTSTASDVCKRPENAEVTVLPGAVAKGPDQKQKQDTRDVSCQYSPIPGDEDDQNASANTSNPFSGAESALSSTSQSSRKVSDVSSTSTNSGKVKISISSPDSGVDECFEMPVSAVCDRKIAAAVRAMLQKSDLRLADIGDPPARAKRDGFKYDFYAIYNPKCDETSDWVYYHLRPQLEEGIDALKGCIQERDFQAGKPIIKNMADAINDSAKILLIISNGFFENAWCDEAVMLAMEPSNKHKVIPIQLQYVPLPSYLKKLHCEDATKTISWFRIRQHLMS